MTIGLATCVMAFVLAALIVAPQLGRLLRPATRRSKLHDGRRHSRRSRRRAQDHAAMLDAIARQVRSGSSLANALVEEGDASSPLGAVADRLSAGGSLREALADVRPTDADLALVLQALSATAHLGGPIAATLDAAAAVLRERAAARAERVAHGSQARISARVLTIVPVGFAAWSAIGNQRTRDVYLSTVAGGVCAACGLALNLLGWVWMQRIVGAT